MANGKTDKAKVRKAPPKAPKSSKRVTIRQQALAKLIVDNVRKPKGKRATKGELAKQAGYSDAISKAPSKIIGSKSFQELMQKYLPDRLILSTHKTLLKAVQLDHYTFSPSMTDAEIKAVVSTIPGAKFVRVKRGPTTATGYFVMPDHVARKAAVDMGYKLKGSYSALKVDAGVSKELTEALDRMAEILPPAGE